MVEELSLERMMNAVSIAKDFLASLEPETPYFYEELPELEGLK